MAYNNTGKTNRNVFTRNAVKTKTINTARYSFRAGIRL